MGTNGLDPVEQAIEKGKCPEKPGKRKYHTLKEAEAAAQRSSSQYHTTIVPYVCPGCGKYHLTGKRTEGSEVVREVNGVLRTTAMDQRDAAKPGKVYPQRVETPVETPIVPGNVDARWKMLLAFLEGKDTASTMEVAEGIGIHYKTVTGYMHQLGWTIKRGPGARWLRPPAAEASNLIALVQKDPVTTAMSRHPSAQNVGWKPMILTDTIRHVPLGDLVDTLKAAGLELKLLIREIQ